MANNVAYACRPSSFKGSIERQIPDSVSHVTTCVIIIEACLNWGC